MSDQSKPDKPAADKPAAAAGAAPAAAEKSAATPGAAKPAAKPAAAKPAAAKPGAKPAAKPAAAKPKPKPKPAKPKAGEASPHQVRPGVVFGGITALKIKSIVVPFEHQVARGETVERIATQYYGNKAKATLIRDANPDLAGSAQPAAGQTIKVPKA